MQGGVFGGLYLLACLLAGVHSEDVDIPKPVEETNNMAKDSSVENEDSKKFKVTFNDLNITKDANYYTATGTNVLSDQANSDKTLPSYSSNTFASSEESRQDTNVMSDEKQTRYADRSQFSENTNAYPYSPPGKLDSSETNDLRSGAPIYTPFENIGVNSAQAYAGTLSGGFNPYSYGYPPGPNSISGNLASANAFAQVSSGIVSAQSSAIVIEDAQSRVIWPSELIFPSKIHGSENTIQCNKENELYHFWSRTYECLVCVCLNVYGLLEPACAKCSGCRHHTPSQVPNFTLEQTPSPPESFIPIPVPNVDPYPPSAPAPSLIVQPIDESGVPTTLQPPVQEVKATCSPLPIGKPYTNPLHPCQLCTCTEMVNESGAVNVIIQCQDNLECVLPTDVTTLPPIPDIPVPVPLPLCEKFPHHVPFPHPTEKCKVCKCSLEVSQTSALEEQITCYHDTECEKRENTTTTETITPPAPPIPIPVEPYAAPIPEPAFEPIPENISVPVEPPNSDTPNTPGELLPWPPISTPAPPPKPFLPKKGPLPGPSPHDSCRPYPPNQPFQHPWDDCQVCQCTVTKAIGVVNVEITCYTKLSCCIESPEQVISAIAGKYFKVLGNYDQSGNGIDDNANNQTLSSSYLSSSVKPPIPPIINGYNGGYAAANIKSFGNLFNQGYATANSVSQNSRDPFNQAYNAVNVISQNLGDPSYQGNAGINTIPHKSGNYLNQGYTPVHAVSQNVNPLNQGYAIGNTLSQNVGVPLNQGYGAANAVSQHSKDFNQGYAVANAINLNSEDSYNQRYTAANAISQSSGGPINQGYAATNTIAQKSGDYLNQRYAPLNTVSQKPANPLNQEYAAANTITQNSENFNQGYAVANVISQNSEDSYNQGYSEANVVSQNSGNSAYAAAASNIGGNDLTYNQGDKSLQGFQNQEYAAAMALNSGLYDSKYLRTQDSVEPIVVAQNDVESLSKKLSRPNQSLYASGQAIDEANAFYGSQGSEPYKARTPPSQEYSDAEYSSLPLINKYDTGVSKKPAYRSSIRTNEKSLSSTYEPPLQYDAYNIDTTLNSNVPEAISQNNDRRTNSQKSFKIGQLTPGFTQNEASVQSNAQQSSILTSTVKPPALYNQYNTMILKNPVQATPNAVYKGTLSMTDKSSIYKPYNTEVPQNSMVEAIVQPQDNSLYYQPEPPLRSNSYGFPYQSNFYYHNPQPYSSKINTRLKGQYKKIPLKYAGTYDFNGQPEKIYSPQSGFNPYTDYSQGRPSYNVHSSLYPSNHDVTPLYHPGHYGSNVQSTADAYAGSKSQSKSGYTEDSEES